MHVPAQPAGTRTAYCESREKETFDWATTACAVRVVIDGGKITAADVVLGAVAPVPLPRPEGRQGCWSARRRRRPVEEGRRAAFAGAARWPTTPTS
jgi:CO/xanthine dehydrogenase FAD-binding subunit